MKKCNEWLSTYPPDMAIWMVTEILDNPQVSYNDEIPNCKGEFGISESNPIPIFGIPNNKNYLNRLRLENSEHVKWERRGSIIVPDIKNPLTNTKFTI